MFAIIQTGGKQYRVQEGDVLQVELLEHGKAKTVKLDQVLLFAENDKVRVGQPLVKGAYCEAEVMGEKKGRKTISFKYIRREKAATKIGHRQKYLQLRIKSLHKGE